MEARVFGPAVDGDVDGEDEVEQEDGHDEEVEGWVDAGVVFIGLGRGHEWSFLSNGGASAWYPMEGLGLRWREFFVRWGFAVGLGDGWFEEETERCACRYGGWNVE